VKNLISFFKIGRDPKFLKILDVIGRVSPTDASVLITGESGTGKELIAEAIHRNSARKNAPFVKVNLGGISSTLFESEMFGHVKGAFTDAKFDRKGRFELANGGTIFLDEIGDLDPSCQVKMLRVLQDRTYEVVGSSVSRTVDVRVISATNRNLPEMIEKGEFREDLLYRLNLIAIHLPSLRERFEDISVLAQHFLQNIGNVYRRNDLAISDAAMKWLQGFNWPGNIRQLKQVIERTVLMSNKMTLEVDDFALAMQMQPDSGKNQLPAVGSMTLDEMEKAMIVKAMNTYQYNITKFIKDKDFTSKLTEAGQPEMDKLIAVYNKMIDHLREERTHLQEQHYFLEKILKASPSGIITFDFDEQVAMVNPSAAKMLQLASDNLIGRKLTELHTPFADALNRLQVGEPQVISLQGRRRVKCQKSQYLDRGFARHFILMEELTEELRRSEKAAYEKLIRMMSHEVNNSIGAVNSLLHSFLNYKNQLRDEDRQDYENALKVAIARTEHLNAFMRSFADVVRLPLPKRQPCDLQALLENIALLMSAESRKREIVWQWAIDEPLEPIVMDKNQMEQVFVNIFKNAMEAIGENGTITIRMSKKGEKRFVIIEDTGAGLTPEARANLFTPFFSTKENGQGIGLTLIQEILSQHRFEFSLDSQPGQPTQFAIYF